MLKPEYDIAIIGLGPAGATLARLLHPRFSIIAIDKKKETGQGFCKPCGGLLAPDAQKALARFDLPLPLHVAVDPQIFSVLTIDVDSAIRRKYQRHYVNLDRHKFDQWLISLVPNTVSIHKGAQCTKIEKVKGGGYKCTWRENGTLHSTLARFVVGADGAASFVRRILHPTFKIKKYMAIQQWFEDKHPSPFYSCIFDSRTTDCYAWGLTKNEYFIFGGAFAPSHARESFEELKRTMASQGFHLDKAIKTEACVVLRPQFPHHIFCGKAGVFLLGEAAGFISPSSLEGLSYAFESARKLAKVLNTAKPCPHSAYFMETLGMRVRLFFKNIKSLLIFSPPIRKWIMRSRINAID